MKLVSISEVAELTGRTFRTVKRRIEEAGVVPAKRTKKSDLYDSRAVLALLFTAASEGGEELDLNAERARLAKEQADKTALENAARRGQMVDALVVVNEWTDQIAAARSRLLATPTKLAPQLVGIQDANVIAVAIRTEMYAALAELSEYDPDIAAGGAPTGATASGEDMGATAAADRQRVGRRKQKAELRE